jgi:hypothetical protein
MQVGILTTELAGWYLSDLGPTAAERAASAVEKLADGESKGEEWKR